MKDRMVVGNGVRDKIVELIEDYIGRNSISGSHRRQTKIKTGYKNRPTVQRSKIDVRLAKTEKAIPKNGYAYKYVSEMIKKRL